jgi:hypothetical protein
MDTPLWDAAFDAQLDAREHSDLDKDVGFGCRLWLSASVIGRSSMN